jgi:hypothetical protein
VGEGWEDVEEVTDCDERSLPRVGEVGCPSSSVAEPTELDEALFPALPLLPLSFLSFSRDDREVVEFLL